MILLIDNYDSFTYNLYQEIGVLYEDILVVRNDEVTIQQIIDLAPEAIVISPGSCYPKQAGISINVVKEFSGDIPILGVCLGHQSIAEAFGGKTVIAKEQLHGKQSTIKINRSNPLFSGLPAEIQVARYHSLTVDSISLPSCLSVIGTDDKAQIMALRHKKHPTYGVQFHPESILTETGKKIISNFLRDVVGIKIARTEAPTLSENQRNELKPYVAIVSEGKDMTEGEAYSAMDIIMSDRATNAQIASFLTALKMKGETIDEITGFAKIMRQKMAGLVNCYDTLDIVGTGGDLANSFNISTTSSFIIAGAGQSVAKHGNRNVSSKCGAADVLEALGVKITSKPDKATQCIKELGISFLFAQSYHSAMRFVGPVRQQLGVRTVFNILGPLANPAKADYMILGVCDTSLLEIMAKVLINLGIKSAMLVTGNDKLDEISISDGTTICEIKDNKIIKYEINPEEFGLRIYNKSEIVGGTAKENAEITLKLLKGETKGAKRDIVLLNSGCALYVCGKASNIEEGIEMARESLDSGKALEKLNQLIEFTNRI
ncbi:MAG: bifunctional anthranilate synthase component II/anthranilate phosphoribosyltransferase [Clostridiales bacterium]|nr:bifunctional anthranilate synthase component II/anthranilate phosphoribosyltransferase [Clostridiales bacterium]